MIESDFSGDLPRLLNNAPHELGVPRFLFNTQCQNGLHPAIWKYLLGQHPKRMGFQFRVGVNKLRYHVIPLVF